MTESSTQLEQKSDVSLLRTVNSAQESAAGMVGSRGPNNDSSPASRLFAPCPLHWCTCRQALILGPTVPGLCFPLQPPVCLNKSLFALIVPTEVLRLSLTELT